MHRRRILSLETTHLLITGIIKMLSNANSSKGDQLCPFDAVIINTCLMSIPARKHSLVCVSYGCAICMGPHSLKFTFSFLPCKTEAIALQQNILPLQLATRVISLVWFPNIPPQWISIFKKSFI